MKTKLTVAKVASAKPPTDKNQDFIWDTQAKGLGLRITQNGVKSYVYQHRVPGKRSPVRETLGGINKLTLEDARNKVYSKILTPQPIEKNSAPTLQKVFDDYKGHKEGKTLSKTTATQYEYFLKKYTKDWLEKTITAITPDMVVTRHADIGNQGHYSANAVYRILRALMNYAKAAYDDLEDWTPPVFRLAKIHGLYPEKRRQTLLRGSEIGHFYNELPPKFRLPRVT